MKYSTFNLISDAIGRENTLKLISSIPRDKKRTWRVCFYIPMNMKRKHRFVKAIGYEMALKLSQAMGGMTVHTVNCQSIYRDFRNETIRRLYKEGNSIALISTYLNFPRRTINYVLNGRCGLNKGPFRGDLE